MSSCTRPMAIIHSKMVIQRGAVAITTAQLYSTKPELKFYAGSNPAPDVPEIRDGEHL